MSEKDRNPKKTERTKKKVEWSSTVDSVALEDRSPNWDSETDHLLSYFLGGEQQGNGVTSPLTHFATTPAPSNHGQPPGILTNRQTINHPSMGAQRLVHHGFSGGPASRSDEGGFDDDSSAPPPTPATQYYQKFSKPKDQTGRPPTSSSVPKMQSSNSLSGPSISGMAASFASGGNPGSRHSSLEQSLESMSPISPAAMIGGGNEELMLPSSPLTTSRTQPQAAATHHQPRQSHLEWLQHINNLAKQAAAASNDQGATAPIPHMQPQEQTPMHHGAMPYPVVAGLPATYGHAPMYYAQAALNQLQQQQAPVPESEEKRAKRLERNRESARKSRRRKKERLNQLGDKVGGLHNQIDIARTIQINLMNPQLQEFFLQRIAQLDADFAVEMDEATGKDQLAAIFKGTGPNCGVKRAVIDFQYSKLKQTLLPHYQKFLIWLTLHPESWFSAGKEDHAKRETARQVVRVTSGKISSKQVGDELTNGSKLEDGTVVPPPVAPQPSASGEKATQSAQAFDELRMWPLLCFELSISVDQEERILHQAYKTAKKRQDLQHCRSQIEAATRMASRLKEAVLLQSHNVAVRTERTYLEIMTPRQSVLFHKWSAKNRERCRETVGNQKTTQRTRSPVDMDYDSKTAENLTLIEVCRKLEAVLKISKGESDDWGNMG